MTKLVAICMLTSLSVFILACASAGSRFDDTKIQQIEKGKTTQGEVRQLLGEPSGKGVNADGSVKWQYYYSKSSVIGGASTKIFEITFDKNGIVREYSYQEIKF